MASLLCNDEHIQNDFGDEKKKKMKRETYTSKMQGAVKGRCERGG
jgi:hypothetical protein